MLISKTITGALRMIGVLAVGEDPTANEMEDALETLNTYIDTLNADGAMVTYQSLELWYTDKALDSTLGRIMTVTKNETVIDPANIQPGQVYAEAPISVINLELILGTSVYKLKEVGTDKYTSMLTEIDTTARPTSYMLNFKGDVLEIYFDTKWDEQYTVSAFVKLPYLGTSGDYKATDDINWEYGIERMLRTNLAVRLAPEYGVQVPPTIYEEAKSLENTIRNKGVNVGLMDTGLNGSLSGNINTDWREE